MIHSYALTVHRKAARPYCRIRLPGGHELFVPGGVDARGNPTIEAIRNHAAYRMELLNDPDWRPRSELPLMVTMLGDWLNDRAYSPTSYQMRRCAVVTGERIAEWCKATGRDPISTDEWDAEAWASFQSWLAVLPHPREAGKSNYNASTLTKIRWTILKALTWAKIQKRYGVTADQIFDLQEVPRPANVRPPDVVLPAKWEDVEAVAAVAHPQLAAALRVQWWIGSRPSELLRLRVGEIQRTGTLSIPKVAPVELGEVWAAHVPSKARRFGHVRVLMFGPRAQAILEPILKGLRPTEYVFSPRRTGEQWAGAKDRYSREVMNNALRYATGKAKCTPFTLQSIRHACSERVVKAMGDKAEQAYLGHDSSSKITRNYAGFDSTLAAEVARKLG